MAGFVPAISGRAGDAWPDNGTRMVDPNIGGLSIVIGASHGIRNVPMIVRSRLEINRDGWMGRSCYSYHFSMLRICASWIRLYQAQMARIRSCSMAPTVRTLEMEMRGDRCIPFHMAHDHSAGTCTSYFRFRLLRRPNGRFQCIGCRQARGDSVVQGCIRPLGQCALESALICRWRSRCRSGARSSANMRAMSWTMNNAGRVHVARRYSRHQQNRVRFSTIAHRTVPGNTADHPRWIASTLIQEFLGARVTETSVVYAGEHQRWRRNRHGLDTHPLRSPAL